MTRTVPHDDEADQIVVGGMLAYPHKIDEALTALSANDFHNVTCGKVFTAIASLHASGHAIDDHAVHVESGVLELDVNALHHSAPGSATRWHVERVLRLSTARRLMTMGEQLADEAEYSNADPYALVDQAASDLSSIVTPVTGTPEAVGMESILTTSEDLSPWVIKDLLRSDWRVLIVAGEGHGKSTLLRQIGMCSSQGINPFRFNLIMPIRVLLVDLENPIDSIKETGGQLHRAIVAQNGGYDDEGFQLWRQPGGIDIRTRRDAMALEREIAAHQPDLLIIGPIYKLSQRKARESHEESTEPVLHVLDTLRTRYGFALIMETHPPQEQQGHRPMRPFGSSLWMRWPEIGLGLRGKDNDRSTLDVEPFRGARLVNKWPNQLIRGSTWPWTARWTSTTDM